MTLKNQTKNRSFYVSGLKQDAGERLNRLKQMAHYELIPRSAKLEALHEYWLSIRAGRRMPAHADIDPVEMPRHLLANILLVEVSRAPLRFYYRVMGTGIVKMLGEDWTGKFVDEVIGVNQNVLQQYIDVAESAEPSIYFNQFSKFDKLLGRHRMLDYERLLLPLSDDDQTVHHLLGSTILTPTAPPSTAS